MTSFKYVSIFPGNDKTYLKNAMFNIRKNKGVEIPIYVNLKNLLKTKNVQINTVDTMKNKITYMNIYKDLPYPVLSNFYIWKKIFTNRAKNILLCSEPPMVLPFNYMKFIHYFFVKVYTWNDDLVDNKKYFKFRLPVSILGIGKPMKFKNKKFLVMINSNKVIFYPFKLLSGFGKELYSERIKAIEFFEKYIPDRFFLYGMGWNQAKRNNIKELMFGFKKYTSYHGKVDDKIELLSNFRYCLCFENLTDVPGFITEKIFDCFKAKCVPVYWGASDIEKHIPKNCFIDFRDFKSYRKLLNYLDLMPESKYNSYIKNIETLLSDKRFINTWFEKGYADLFLRDILEVVNYGK